MSRKENPKIRGLRKLANERDVKRAAMNVFNWVIRGEVTPAQASSANGALQVARAAIQTEVERQVIDRLEKLEAEAQSGGLEKDSAPHSSVVPLSLVRDA